MLLIVECWWGIKLTWRSCKVGWIYRSKRKLWSSMATSEQRQANCITHKFSASPPWEMYITYPVPASSRPPASSAVRVVHDVLKTVICLKLTTFIIEGKTHRSVAYQLSHSGNNCNIYNCNVVYNVLTFFSDFHCHSLQSHNSSGTLSLIYHDNNEWPELIFFESRVVHVLETLFSQANNVFHSSHCLVQTQI